MHIGSKPIEFDGSEAQKRRWLPELASGRTVGASRSPSPRQARTRRALATTARRDGDAYVLNGAKIYITNAAEAGSSPSSPPSIRRSAARGITAFLVEAGTPGLTVGRTHRDGGGPRLARMPRCVFARLPRTGRQSAGRRRQGLRLAMRCLDAGRTHWGAYCVGAPQRLLDLAVARASARETFGRPLREHQGIEWMLADMAASLHAARLVAYEAAWRYDQDDAAVALARPRCRS